MATHASILAPWTEPGGIQSTGHKESDTTEATRHVCTHSYLSRPWGRRVPGQSACPSFWTERADWCHQISLWSLASLGLQADPWVLEGPLTHPPSGLIWPGDPSCCFHCCSACAKCLERPWRVCRICLCLCSVSSRPKLCSPGDRGRAGTGRLLGWATDPVF